MEDDVILVDPNDVAIGTAPKLRAHVEGTLHRAFSVFVFNSSGEVLLQRRADDKYHSGGLWSNTCCSHPRPGEDTAAAAQRRLAEEMGLSIPLDPAFSFTYRATLPDGLCEHEYDHVFIGRTDGDPTPDPREVAGWRWMSVEQVSEEMRADPASFTVWFREPFEKLLGGSDREAPSA